MFGPVFGGFMLAQGWDLPTIYLVTGTPLFVAALSILFIGRWTPTWRDRNPVPTPEPAAGDTPVVAKAARS